MAKTIAKWFFIFCFILATATAVANGLTGEDATLIKETAPAYSRRYEEFYTTTRRTYDTTTTTPPTTRPTTQPTTQPTTEPIETTTWNPPVDPPLYEKYLSFVPSEEPNYRDITMKWISPNDGREYSQTHTIDQNAYQYYRSLPRYNDFNDYQYYLDDEYNRKTLSSVADSFRRFGRKYGLTDDEVILEAIRFVQSIPYAYDIDSTGEEEFQKYPVETLFDHEGDCEDTSLLLAGLLRELGCNVCLLHLPGHAAVGLQDTGTFSGRYYEVDGNQYFYIESTNTGWEIGEMPEQYVEATAKIYVID